MTCCIVGLLIMMAVGRIRRAIGRAPSDSDVATLFAPVAQRPAPGAERLAPAPAISDLIDGDGKPASASVFQYAAVGIALSLIMAPALVWIGAAANTAAVHTWLLRSVLYLVVIVAAVLLGRTAAVLRAPRGAASLLIVVGVIVFELGLADMHLFQLFDIEAGLTGDMVFHNVGPALAIAGGLMLLYGAAGRSRTSRRPSRSTVTSARPSSSAVTVSSTPPVTT